MAHTKGPWALADVFIYSKETRDPIMSTKNITLDNSKLIAAAPELLDALRDCQDALRIHAPDVWALEQANKAIAKATGTKS